MAVISRDAAFDEAYERLRVLADFVAAAAAVHEWTEVFQAIPATLAGQLAALERIAEPTNSALATTHAGGAPTLPERLNHAVDEVRLRVFQAQRSIAAASAHAKDAQTKTQLWSIEQNLKDLLAELGPAASGWRSQPADSDGRAAQVVVAARELADRARTAMFAALMQELQTALSNGGTVAAIEICSQRAPEIGSEISARFGVRIGRTSKRLRNPANEGPLWALEAIAGEPESRLEFEDRFGRMGFLSPIRLAPDCRQCHGQAEELSGETQRALQRLYPKDCARGFATGDLRGYFWVEVPAPR